MIAAVVLAPACSYSTESALERGSFAEVPTTPPPPTTAAPVFETDDPLDVDSRVAIDGIGDVTFGMPIDEAMAVAGRVLVPISDVRGDCWEAEPDGGPEGVEFMVVDGVIASVAVVSGEVVTLSGAGIGTSVSRLRQLFGSSLSSRAAPSGPGEWWVLRSGASAHRDLRVVFVTRDDVVVGFRAGRVPEVEWEECP